MSILSRIPSTATIYESYTSITIIGLPPEILSEFQSCTNTPYYIVRVILGVVSIWFTFPHYKDECMNIPPRCAIIKDYNSLSK